MQIKCTVLMMAIEIFTQKYFVFGGEAVSGVTLIAVGVTYYIIRKVV